MSYKIKQTPRAEPCTCGGRVVTQADPDSTRERRLRDMTYCLDCAQIHSPWTPATVDGRVVDE